MLDRCEDCVHFGQEDLTGGRIKLSCALAGYSVYTKGSKDHETLLKEAETCASYTEIASKGGPA